MNVENISYCAMKKDGEREKERENEKKWIAEQKCKWNKRQKWAKIWVKSIMHADDDVENGHIIITESSIHQWFNRENGGVADVKRMSWEKKAAKYRK